MASETRFETDSRAPGPAFGQDFSKVTPFVHLWFTWTSDIVHVSLLPFVPFGRIRRPTDKEIHCS